MKKFLSIILAVVMLVAMVPATFVSAAEGDIVFDFAWFKDNLSTRVDFATANFPGLTINTTGTGAKTGVLTELSNSTLRLNNMRVDWQTYSNSREDIGENNKIAFDYNVPTAGWYTFAMPFSSNSTTTATVAVYDIYNEVPSFLGELKYNSTSPAVYLEAGTHTLLICGVYSAAGAIDNIMVSKFIFTKVDAPTGSVAVDGFPTTTLKVGTEVTGLEAVVNTNYGVHEISGFGVKMSAANVKYRVETAGDTHNYLKVTYENPGVVEVTVTPNTAVGAKGSVNYSIKAIAEGTTDVTFTPVIGGVEQTALATTKTISVLDPNINYDFEAFFKANEADVSGKTIWGAPVQMPNFAANTTGTSTESYHKWMNSGIRIGNVYGDWETKDRSGTTENNKVVWDITVPAGKAGWYTPSMTMSANKATDTLSMYNIAGGKVVYVGDFTSTATTANAVYLYEGPNSLLLAVTEGNYTTFFPKSLAFTKIDAPATAASFDVSAPETIRIGTEATGTGTVAMSDGKNYYFPAKTANPTTFTQAGADTNAYIKVEVSTPDIVSVSATTTARNRDKVSFTYTGLKEGTTDITFTPVIDGVPQTALETTKTISVVDENITFDFNAHVTALNNPSANVFNIDAANPYPQNMALNASSKSVPVWENRGSKYLRFSSVDTASGYGFDITVPRAKAGMYYTPSISFGSSNNCTYHVHVIANGKKTYVGDTKTGEKTVTLKPVQLVEGVNTLTFTPAVVASDGVAFINSFKFLKYDGEVATVQAMNATAPTSVSLGKSSESHTVTVAMNDGTNLQFPYFGMAPNFSRTGANTDNYIKFDVSPADALSVSVTKGDASGSGYDTLSYTLTGLKPGTATLTITPVVAGVPQTTLAMSEEISVVGGNIVFDLSAASNAAAAAEGFDANSPFFSTDEDDSLISHMPEGFAINESIGLALDDDGKSYGYRWYKGSGLRVSNFGTYWASDNDKEDISSILAFDITIADGSEGYYRPKVEFSAYQDSAKNVIYVINENGAQFAGYMASAQSGLLNPILFEKGKNTLIIACYDATKDATTAFIKQIVLDKCDEVPTIANVAVSAPLVVTAKTNTGLIEATATMSDGSTFAFEKYAMDPATAMWAGVSTDAKNYIAAVSSNPAIADVEKTGAGSYRINAKTDGDVKITVTPYIGGDAQTPVEKTVNVTYPNASLKGVQRILVDAIVGNGEGYDTTDLIVTNGIVVGDIGEVAVGSRVTLTAKSTPALQFLYWYNGNTKKILSEEETYSFDVGTKGAIYAKYADTSKKLTEYASANGQLVKSDYTNFGTEPDAEIGTYYEMFVEDFEEEGDEAAAEEKTTESDAFVCWKKDGKIVSYSKTYKYYPWTGTEVVEESTEGEKSTLPAVVLFENGNARMLELVNFDGVEIIEKGILFGESGANVNSYETKAVSTTDKKQFMATSDLAYARAYVIYKDGATYRVAYSD